MSRRGTTIAMACLVVLLTLGILVPPEVGAIFGYVRRLAADFQAFDATENETNAGVDVDGLTVYEKTVFVPFDANTLYVTISATGDTHDGSALWLSCRFDGAFCSPGTGGAAGTPAGWISVNKLPLTGLEGAATNCNNGGGGSADCHDNSIYYTWCVRTGPGTHRVAIHMATSDPGSIVFTEAVHYYVDAAFISGENRCTRIPSRQRIID